MGRQFFTGVMEEPETMEDLQDVLQRPPHLQLEGRFCAGAGELRCMGFSGSFLKDSADFDG